MPLTSSRSLAPMGIPANGPGSSPWASGSAMALAYSRARSLCSETKAFIEGFTSSIFLRQAWTSSTGDREPACISRDSSLADLYKTSSIVSPPSICPCSSYLFIPESKLLLSVSGMVATASLHISSICLVILIPRKENPA